MKTIIKFNRNYFILFILLFIIEVLIALYVHDNFVRPYFGDVLVVILIYCFLKSILNISKFKILIFVLLFSFSVEIAQYFNIVSLLGLQNSKLANVVLGNSFAFKDLFCYLAGFVVIIMAAYGSNFKKNNL